VSDGSDYEEYIFAMWHHVFRYKFSDVLEERIASIFCLLGILFDPEDGCSTFHQNFRTLLPDYMVSHANMILVASNGFRHWYVTLGITGFLGLGLCLVF
jgi:hypothetical protein